MLKGEVDAEDLFTSLLRYGKYINRSHVRIGENLIVHAHGRKVLSSLPNELSMVAERPVYVAGAHRFMIGQSQSGRPVGHLAGLYWSERLGYYMKNPKRLNTYVNGFFFYENGGLTPYSDLVNTDWGEFGCE